MVYGEGNNDSDEVTIKEKVVDEKRIITYTCHIYKHWNHMLERCYSSVFQSRYPTYAGCTVCEEWKTFSKFKEWVVKQDYKNKELDKDLLKSGNKVYSPETCLFISKTLNSFLAIKRSSKGDFPIGVCYENRKKKFRSRRFNTQIGKREHLGYYNDQFSAHKAWQRAKLLSVDYLISLEYDSKVLGGLNRIKSKLIYEIAHDIETVEF